MSHSADRRDFLKSAALLTLLPTAFAQNASAAPAKSVLAHLLAGLEANQIGTIEKIVWFGTSYQASEMAALEKTLAPAFGTESHRRPAINGRQWNCVFINGSQGSAILRSDAQEITSAIYQGKQLHSEALRWEMKANA